MARFWDEKFEGAGYEETWSEGEIVGVGSTVDEDADPADAGSPANWGSNCLHIGSTGNTAYVYHKAGSTKTDVWTRIEFVCTAESFGDWDYVLFAKLLNKTTGVNAWELMFFQNGSSELKIRLISYYDGNSNNFDGFPVISLDTLYRIEIKWDSTNNVWAWRINGVDQPNNVDGSDPVESEGTLSDTHEDAFDSWYLGIYVTTEAAATLYYDLYALDDADWIGAEEAPPEENIVPLLMHQFRQRNAS